MHGEASSSQASIGSSGSGALSHVYVQYPPLRCNVSGSKGLFYDDGNMLLLSPTSDQVFSWKVAPFAPNVEPTCDSVSEGPVLSIRYSLDGKTIAIQRSSHEIQFWNREKGNSVCHRCKPESEKILGFFWTDCRSCNFALVKTSGLDFLNFDSESQNIQLVESKRVNVSWYIYTHGSRLVLLASGMQCKSFIGFQLSSVGIICLPKFEMLMAKSEVNSKPILAAEDIHVITVYGRIYCLQVDRVAMLLHCYRFYRDAVVPQGSISMYSSKVSVSVVDNVLLVHQVDAKVVMLYDLYAESRAPVSAPLPLLLRGYPKASMSSKLSSKDDGHTELKWTDDDFKIYSNGWTFLNPDLVCDTASGLLWKIHLDLDAISTSSSDVPSVLEFLQRRKLEASKAKQLCLALVRTVILEHRAVSVIAQVMDVLMTSYSRAIKTGSYFKGIKSDNNVSSDAQPAHNPQAATDESTKDDSRGGPVKIGSFVGSDERVNRSAFSDSESEDKIGSISDSSNLVKGAESSDIKVQPSSSQSQVPGPSNVPLDANNEDQHDSQIASAAISPDELCRFVFYPIDEEMSGDPAYLVAILIEFLHSATLERIRMHPILYVLMIKLLARGERYGELGLFVIDKIIEPSKEVAYQLLESGRQHRPTRKLGIDMLRQLFLHHDYVLSLLQDGYYLEALRYARKYKVVSVRPSLFLEAAYASNETQHLATVLRFFSDFMPGFKNTSDHATYCEILNQMNAAYVTA